MVSGMELIETEGKKQGDPVCFAGLVYDRFILFRKRIGLDGRGVFLFLRLFSSGLHDDRYHYRGICNGPGRPA
jgi:hypothetical protein